MKKLFLSFSALCILLSSSLYSQDISKIPKKLMVYSPQENTSAVKNQVLFKGVALDADFVKINDTRVSLDNEGRFYHVETLKGTEPSYVFNIASYKGSSKVEEITRQVMSSEVSKPMSTPSSSIPPVISILFPGDNYIAKKSPLVIKGSIKNAVSLSINGTPISFDQSGQFSYSYSPQQTYVPQSIKFIAKSASGQEIQETRRIIYRPIDESAEEKPVSVEAKPSPHELKPVTQEPQPSTVLVASPQETYNHPESELPNASSIDSFVTVLDPPAHFISHKNKVLFKGSVEPGVTLSLNGEPLSIDPSTHTFFHRASLINKNQYASFHLIAKNNAGLQSQKSFRIFYDASSEKQSLTSPKKSSTTKSLSSSSQESDIQNTSEPDISITNPPQNFVTLQNTVLVEGTVKNTKELLINNHKITLNSNGYFKQPFNLEVPGKYVFTFYASGKEGNNKTIVRKVFRSETPSQDVASNAISRPSGLKKKISLDLAGSDIKDVMQVLAKKGDLNIVSDKSLTGEVFLSLQNITIAHAIDMILSSQGLSYKLIGNTIIVGNTKYLETASKLENRVIHLNNVSATSVTDLIKPYLSDKETAQAVSKENILVLNVDYKKIPHLMKMIEKLDANKIPQILLEAQVIEVSKSSLDNIGVAWNSAYGVGAQGVYTGGSSGSNSNFTVNFNLATQINMLESQGKAKILAKPKIKAVDQEEAAIFIGDRIPYQENSIDPSGRISQAVKYIDAGINLKIKPFINPFTKEIKIQVQPEVSYVNGFKGQNGDVPVVRTRKVSTTVFVKDGKTVLIGGLFNSSDSNNKNSFPLLGRIPIMGKLFSNTKNETEETELVIAITPRIIETEFEEMVAPGKDNK